MKYLTAEQVLFIHARLIAETGGSHGVRDLSGLESAVERPQATFDGKELYPDLFMKTAALLDSLVNNHPFVDGNKRIAAALFLWFLQKNRFLYRPDGSKRIANNALVAMTLLIAESRPAEKRVLVSVIVNLINKRNP